MLQFRFVVMGNMFCTELRIHRRFDLKGSSLGRSADKVEIDENTTLKDLDLNYSFYLEPTWREALLKYVLIKILFCCYMCLGDIVNLIFNHCACPRPAFFLVNLFSCIFCCLYLLILLYAGRLKLIVNFWKLRTLWITAFCWVFIIELLNT